MILNIKFLDGYNRYDQWSLDLSGHILEEFLVEARHLLNFNHVLLEDIVFVPKSTEIHVHVLLKSSSLQALILSDDRLSSLFGTSLVDPELGSGLDLELIKIAASAIAAAILRNLPEVHFLLSEAAVAIAAAIDDNINVGSGLFAEGVAFSDEHIHKMIITILGVPIGHHVWILFLLLANMDSNVSVFLLDQALWFLHLMLNLIG